MNQLVRFGVSLDQRLLEEFVATLNNAATLTDQKPSAT